MPRSEVVKRMWAYFKEHNLLDPHNKQFVNCDETLAKLFGRKFIFIEERNFLFFLNRS
jgi:chromatin remodeling complex protein RSC6